MRDGKTARCLGIPDVARLVEPELRNPSVYLFVAGRPVMEWTARIVAEVEGVPIPHHRHRELRVRR